MGLLCLWLFSRAVITPRFILILALAATFMLAFLPWHIHLTRVSFLAIFGLAFLLSGTYFFIKGKKDNRFYILGTLLLAASTQAHYGYKLLAPVIFLELCIFEFKNFSKQKSLLLGVILIWAGAILVSAVSYSKYNTNFRVAELVNNNVFMVIREYFRSFSLNFLSINGDYYRLNNPWGTGILPLVMQVYYWQHFNILTYANSDCRRRATICSK